VGNKQVVVYFLVAYLMFDVDIHECESGPKDYHWHDMISVLDSEEQTSEIATTYNCVGIR
jgi:hypothetical protein